MALDLSGVSLPFTAGDLLSAGMALLGLVAAFVLLAMAFDVVPKFIGLIRKSFTAARGRG